MLTLLGKEVDAALTAEAGVTHGGDLRGMQIPACCKLAYEQEVVAVVGTGSQGREFTPVGELVAEDPVVGASRPCGGLYGSLHGDVSPVFRQYIMGARHVGAIPFSGVGVIGPFDQTYMLGSGHEGYDAVGDAVECVPQVSTVWRHRPPLRSTASITRSK